MTEGDREPFEQKLAVLFAGIDKPLGEAAREAFWRGLQRMSLVEFTRCVDLLLREQEASQGPRGRFGVGDIWQAKNRLRAPAPTLREIAEQQSMGWDGDAWDVRANRRLLRHVIATLGRDPRRYGDPGLTNVGPAGHPPTPEFQANVAQLVRAKNAWAADMRDLDENGATGVSRKIQDRCWDDLIGRAELKAAA